MFAIFILLLMTQCHPDRSITVNVSPAEAAKLSQDNNPNPGFIILDVRTPGEFSSGQIKGANNIDFRSDDFETNISRLDKNKTYLVYCHSGNRSSQAVSMMKDKGFKSLKNLDGGIANWVAENLPVVTE